MYSNAAKKILVIDDELLNIKLLNTYLHAESYQVLNAQSGATGLEIAIQQTPDLILLDIMMQGMDGYEVARKLKDQPLTQPIPIIMVTSLSDRDSRLKALQAGAEEFLTKPVDRTELWVRVRNLLRLKDYADFMKNHNKILEAQVLERTAQLQSNYRETIFTLTRAAEYRDDSTGSHVARVSFYVEALGEHLGLDNAYIEQMFYASPMHDIGKMAIPDSILHKSTALNADEWQIMQTHSTMGHEILQECESPYMKMGAEIALMHHEAWDGSGYPLGLKGEQIPMSCRIMAICDQYDALRSPRPYKPAFSHQKSVDVLTRGDSRSSPEQFAPDVLAAFVECADKLAQIYDKNQHIAPHYRKRLGQNQTLPDISAGMSD
jgi:putative two-component system response regulator